jgi:regulation of enolase protein 1 (concanavalin A-like superfamily)
MFGRADAASLTVCASGCEYTNLQPAINAAVAGDTILLRAGEKFVGNFTLKAKPGTSTAFITIRSDAPDSSFPADGVRLVPPGKAGANVAAGAMAKLVGQGGGWKSTPVLRAEPGAHHYRLQFFEIDGTANLGYETLFAIGDNNSGQTTNALAPYSIVVDRLYLHGHPSKGMKRGIALNSRATDILNCYISDIMSVSDAQAIGGFNGAGPYRIFNNYLEASGENIMFGGSDPRTPNLVPSDIEIRRNHIYKKPSWRNAIMNPPGSVRATAGGGGAMKAGTHFFKVAAVMAMGGSEASSAGSAEVSASVGASGAVTLSWSAISGADKYRVYRGTSAGGETVYMETSGNATTFTYTGATEKSGAPKAAGTRWTSKNLIELKNAQRVTIDGNLLENNWDGFQNGYAILFTPKNQEKTAPWTTVQDITFTNNIVRHVAAGVNISGRDYESSTQIGHNFRIANNVFDDVSSSYGNTGRFMVIANGPKNIVIDHNTIRGTGTIVEVEGPAVPGFVFTNNMALHNQYGIKGQSHATGLDTLNFYFPGWVVTGNALAGGSASVWPAGNYFPSVAEFNASFVNAAIGDFTLLASSIFNGAAADGTDIGIDSDAFAAAQVNPDDESPVTPPDDGGVTSPPAGDLPTDWQSLDIGTVVLPGGASQANGVFTIKGAGADIWGTADAFQFAYTPLAGDGTITARVSSVAGTEPWSKVGVMIRASTAANAQQALMLVSLGKGLAFQRRTVTGALSINTPGPTGTAPRWVRLSRHGNTITAYASSNGTSWTLVDSDTFTMPANVLVGLAATNHSTAGMTTGVVDHVSVSTAEGLPAGWQSNDIGNVGLAGSASETGGTFTVTGAGADVWGTSDALQFTSRTLEGDGEIVAHVASLSGSAAWTKVGVMMRMTLDAGSAQAFMLVSAGKGIAFQRRTLTGGTSTSSASLEGTAPRWVKLARQGLVITASTSTDGVKWTVIGSDTFSIVGSVEVGLAVSSHEVTRRATGTFDSVTVN